MSDEDFDMDEDEGDSSGWDEMEGGEGDGLPASRVACLFCQEAFDSVDDAIVHCGPAHSFDLPGLKGRLKMECYSYIKMVNYIRANNPDPVSLAKSHDPPWLDDKYLKPVIEDDPWLLFDFDDLEIPVVLSGNTGYHVNAEDGRVTLSEAHFAELQKRIQDLTTQVKEKEAMVAEVMKNMAHMRGTLSRVFGTSPDASNGGGDDEAAACLTDTVRSTNALTVNEDQHYFDSYSHFGIHHEMLSDRVRTESYRNALVGNSALMSGKTVLDLGCGTGILAMFAAKAGASKVIAIDQSEIVYNAIDIIRENRLNDTIEVLKGRIEDTKLPLDKVDVIVSEWMGYFLMFEAMLDSVIYTRDHHLAPGGILLPNRCTISLAGFSSPDRYKQLVEFWHDVYGFQMSCLQKEMVREPVVEVAKAAEQVTDPCQIYSIDLMTATVHSVDFTADFALSITRDSELTSIVGYFDVFFELPNPVSFSTGPHAAPTHWKQTVFLLKEKIPVRKGEIVSGKMICQRHRKEVRSLMVTLFIKNQKQVFVLH